MPKKNSKGTYLPEHCLGQFKDPEVRQKAAETRKRNTSARKAKKVALKEGFDGSLLADPEHQTNIINKLYQHAMGDDLNMAKWALKLLNEMGVIRQPVEKPEEPVAAKEEVMPLADSVSILKQAQKEASK